MGGGLIVMLILLALLNPSLRDFKDNGHSGSICYREYNCLLFSTFTSIYKEENDTYLGIFKNFILLKKTFSSPLYMGFEYRPTHEDSLIYNPLEVYYVYLKNAGADVPTTFYSFEKTLKSEKVASKYYNYLLKNKFDVPPTFESFKKTLRLK